MIFLVVVGVVIFGKVLHSSLSSRITVLTTELAKLQLEVHKLRELSAAARPVASQTASAGVTSPVTTSSATQVTNQVVTPGASPVSLQGAGTSSVTAGETAGVTSTPSAPRTSVPQPVAAPIARPPTAFRATEVPPEKTFRDSEIWKKLELQIAGNVTGVVGTLAVVLGVIFLGVYAAIQLPPVGRFGVVCLFSLALLALYHFLSQKSFWRDISLWIRSASGVLFFMGFLGSVGI
jgi:uncharacterized membrane protein